MGNGVDPAFERTVQIVNATADSGIFDTGGGTQVDPSVLFGIVPSGQSWLVERIAVQYRPGAVPSITPIYFRLCANGLSPLDQREGIALVAPSGTFVAGKVYNYFADESSPVRFFANESVIATAPLYPVAGPPKHTARLLVVAQIRIVAQIDQGAASSASEARVPATPAEQVSPHEPTWG